MFDSNNKSVLFYLQLAVSTYFLYVICELGNDFYSSYIEHIANPNIRLFLITYSLDVLISSILTILTTIVFWESYFIKYKKEKAFENIHLKAIAASIVLTVLIAITLNRATQLAFTLTTFIILLRRFGNERTDSDMV